MKPSPVATAEPRGGPHRTGGSLPCYTPAPSSRPARYFTRASNQVDRGGFERFLRGTGAAAREESSEKAGHLRGRLRIRLSLPSFRIFHIRRASSMLMLNFLFLLVLGAASAQSGALAWPTTQGRAARNSSHLVALRPQLIMAPDRSTRTRTRSASPDSIPRARPVHCGRKQRARSTSPSPSRSRAKSSASAASTPIPVRPSLPRALQYFIVGFCALTSSRGQNATRSGSSTPS